MSYRPGERAGRYQVKQHIGRGSFGVVLLAEDTRRPAKFVALKVVPCDHLDEEAAAKARNTALSEADILRRLRHPNIVSCHEVCWDAERCVVWLALDYMDGGDVQAVINARRALGAPRMEEPFLIEVLASVGNALQYIHSEGVLHRDVKPSNILLNQAPNSGEQRIKLTDFGISKLLATSHARTVVGTPYYMAPEIVCGSPYGPACDGWALGVCLFEMATGARAFDASNQLALARYIVEEPPGPLPEDIAPALAQVILQLLHKDPQLRLRLCDALRLIDATPPAPVALTSPRTLNRWSPERRAIEDDEPPAPSLPDSSRHGTKLSSWEGEFAEVVIVSHEPPARHEVEGLLAGKQLRQEAFGKPFGIAENASAKSKKGLGHWFRFGKHFRPAQSPMGNREDAAPKETETTTVSAFAYDAQDDDSDSGGVEHAEAERLKPTTVKAWQ